MKHNNRNRVGSKGTKPQKNAATILHRFRSNFEVGKTSASKMLAGQSSSSRDTNQKEITDIDMQDENTIETLPLNTQDENQEYDEDPFGFSELPRKKNNNNK